MAEAQLRELRIANPESRRNRSPSPSGRARLGDGSFASRHTRFAIRIGFAAVVLFSGCSSAETVSPGNLRMAIFASDVTPPIGHPLCGGWIKPADRLSQPLALKGIILD